MSPIRRGPIIEIDSAPEPYHNARTARSTSRARSTGAKANATSEAKIRAKRPKALIGPVIELTDSEPDVTDEEPREAKRRREPSPSNVASPSNATRRKTTPMNDVPLFFPSDNVVRQIFGVDLEGVEGAGGGKGDKGKGRAVVEEDEEIEDGTGIDIECQCCFGEYPFVRFNLSFVA